MTPLRRVVVGLVAVTLVVLALGAAPALAEPGPCPTAPADDPTLTGVELQLLKLRQEQAATCAALQPGVEGVEVRNDEGSNIWVGGTVSLEGESSTTATLSADDSGRLDLTWWGVWFACGLLLVLLLVPAWEKAWRFWRE